MKDSYPSLKKDLLELLKSYIEQGLTPPTLRGLALELGVASTNAIRLRLQNLKDEGIIQMDHYKTRSIQLIETERQGIPILGSIAAGVPIENVVSEFEELPLSPQVFGPSSWDLYALKVCGDSMIDAAIIDGDYAIIKKQENVENREIAAVLIDGEGTLKRVVREDNNVELHAENEAYDPIILSDENENIIFGKMIALFRFPKNSNSFLKS